MNNFLTVVKVTVNLCITFSKLMFTGMRQVCSGYMMGTWQLYGGYVVSITIPIPVL
jgi:hypothetical protein